jgi:hypothetical protein
MRNLPSEWESQVVGDSQWMITVVATNDMGMSCSRFDGSALLQVNGKFRRCICAPTTHRFLVAQALSTATVHCVTLAAITERSFGRFANRAIVVALPAAPTKITKMLFRGWYFLC